MTPSAEARSTDRPFQFVTASYLECVESLPPARTINDLLSGLGEASDGAIFHHTFQTLSLHHFLEGFSNDFAQWVLAGLNRPALAERLASIDVRDYLSIAELRADLKRIVAEFAAANPQEAAQTAFEPFYFCGAAEVTRPLPWEAHTLAGFRAGLERLSRASFYYHFIASRLRLQLRTNDFSHWFSNALGLDALAVKANRIDIYTNTLDTARRELIDLVDKEIQ